MARRSAVAGVVVTGVMGASAAVFDLLADDYDGHFAVPHRWMYDQLAWERVVALLPDRPGVVVDAGCGTGRWVRRLVGLGHRVVGIEAAPAMARASRRLAAELGEAAFRLVETPMEIAAPPVGQGADLVVAMGSVQFTTDPVCMLGRLRSWLKPGGAAAVMVDSLVALGLELVAAGDVEQALVRTASGRAVWAPPEAGGASAESRLFDRESLETAMRSQGFVDVSTSGLLVSMSATGRPAFEAAFRADRHALLELNRRLARVEALADTGKQLLAVGRRAA